MSSPFHAVAGGLRLTNVGFLLTCWGVGSAVGLTLVSDRVYYYEFDEFRWLFVGLTLAALLTGIAGLVVGIIGRLRCLKVPSEFPAVRGRALTAAVLEGCGWASLVVGIGVFLALGFSGFYPEALWVPAIGLGFSSLLLFGGRVMFLRFLRVLARVIDDAASAGRADWSLALFLADWAAGLIGLAIMIGGSTLGMYSVSTPFGFFVWTLAGMSGLAGLIVYDRVLGGLSRSVRAFADAGRDEEEVDDRWREDDEGPSATDPSSES